MQKTDVVQVAAETRGVQYASLSMQHLKVCSSWPSISIRDDHNTATDNLLVKIYVILKQKKRHQKEAEGCPLYIKYIYVW